MQPDDLSLVIRVCRDSDYLYKSALDLSDMSDAMNDQTADRWSLGCVAALKPGVSDAPLRGFGA